MHVLLQYIQSTYGLVPFHVKNGSIIGNSFLHQGDGLGTEVSFLPSPYTLSPYTLSRKIKKVAKSISKNIILYRFTDIFKKNHSNK